MITPRTHLRQRLIVLMATLAGLVVAAPAGAAGVAATQRITYRGLSLRVPRSWPVYDLAREPDTCVRFNRHAVYLGRPGARQACPAVALGHTEAILVSPATGQVAGARLPSGPAAPPGGTVVQLARRGLLVTATWSHDPGVVRRALGDPRIASGSALPQPSLSHAARAQRAPSPQASAASVFTGSGFDACEDPSTTQLQAWLSSSYRAVGLYIGGANMGCSQPNLNGAYVTQAVAEGWHLIPTYVGLQAPGNSCGCAAISPSQAAAQGAAAAENAVADAQAVGIAAGSPIYDDMEAYSAGGSHTTTVLTFLSAWTSELHALGYLSGVYSSTASGIHDLVAADTDPSDTMPDELWIANWNGQQSTADSAVPSSEWANHQRLHQYQGAHNETWGKVKLNVDSDYVDGATVGTGSVTPTSTAPTAPTLRISPQPNGTIALTGSWSGQSGIAAWRPFGATSATSIVPLANPAPKAGVVSHSAFPYFAEQAIGADGQVLGTTPLTPTPPHLVIYGRSVFVPATGLAGVPVGCFVSSPCHVQLTVTRGRTVLAQTNPERVGAERSGIVYFAMTGAGRAALAAAQGRLPVTLSLRDGTQARTGGELTLVSFATSGRGPARAATQSSVVSLVGLTDFVRGGVGGILAGCSGVAPCHASVTLIAGGATIATTGTEFMGANELTYLAFRLTPHGRALLAAAPGNQLGVRAIVSTGVAAATGKIALVGY